MTDDEVREMTDEDFLRLLTRFRDGDGEAYNKVFLYLERKLQPMVSPTLRRRFASVGDWASTRDILHDVLCKMIVYLRDEGAWECQGVKHFHRLTARVLRNTLLDLKRKHFGTFKAHALAEDADADSRLGRPSGLDRWRDQVSVHELIDKLDPDDQEVLELALYSQFQIKELARHLGVSNGHASRLLSRAKERLGQLLLESEQSR